MSRRPSALLCLALAGCGACDAKPSPAALEAGTPSIAEAAAPPTKPVVSSPHAPPPAVKNPPCRDIVTGGAIAEGAWIDLGKGAKLTVKHPDSGRETRFEGPAKVRPCIDRREESWMIEGSFASTPGAGESPGAEQWIVTPWAAIRYAAATVEMTASPAESTVTLRQGSASAFGAREKQAKKEWARLDPATKATKTRFASSGDAASGVQDCEKAAEEAHRLATAIAAPGAKLAELAPKHVSARLDAHAACAMAHVRVAQLPPGEPRDLLEKKASAADARWRTLGE